MDLFYNSRYEHENIFLKVTNRPATSPATSRALIKVKKIFKKKKE